MPRASLAQHRLLEDPGSEQPVQGLLEGRCHQRALAGLKGPVTIAHMLHQVNLHAFDPHNSCCGITS